MGSTPRQHRFQIPMATRSTDVAELKKCPGSWLLKHTREAEQSEATYFELGSALHEGIEVTILEDLDLDQALALVTGRIEDWLADLGDAPVLESSKRGVDTILQDSERMMRSWFKWVHPDSDKRHPTYEDYAWPPRVEVPFQRWAKGLRYPVWGSIDAVFEHKYTADHSAIVDWKSGSSRQRDSNQLHFYQFGLERRAAEGVRAWFHHLDRKQGRSVIQEADPYPGDSVVRRRIQAAEDMKTQIVNGGPVPFKPDWYCNYCPVQHVCPKEGVDPSANRATLRRTLKLVKPLREIETTERVA